MKFIASIMVAIGLVASASAQTDVHLYFGGISNAVDTTAGFLGGAAIQANRLYVGADGHSARPNSAGLGLFEAIISELGGQVTGTTKGVDLSVGGSLYRSDRLSIIPIGIVGYTSGTLCADNDCSDGDFRRANYGAGMVAAIKLLGGHGLHLGGRYTLGYGFALTLGYVR